jgi:acyl-CoA dehydrogenase
MYSNIAIKREIYASQDHQMVRQALIDFMTQRALPFQEEWEEQKFVPRAFWKELGEQGFLCMDIPQEYGGGGFDFTFNAMVLEETRRLGIDFGWAVHSDIVAPYILRYGTEEQKQAYLPKMASG